MSKIKAVIIDDEYLNRKLIELLVVKINPGFEIVGEAENVRDGISVIKQFKPNVVFLDIKMPDGSGFDLLSHFLEIDFDVVFITGFDEYTLQAFDFNALDYVLKPIDLDKFKITLEKVEQSIKSKQNKSDNLKQIVSLYNSEKVLNKLLLNINNTAVLLDIEEIMYIEQGSSETLFTKYYSEKHTSAKPLSEFEFILKNFSNYLKINETSYVNVNFIEKCSTGLKHYITMKNSTVFYISELKKKEIIALLGQ
ncbi:hypothetical protein CNR22_21980 [Sphingobacteriaceae bacterium]|nr:hypothetical protein CNR22_21980 [Sphingobacteriaceae bacterium]